MKLNIQHLLFTLLGMLVTHTAAYGQATNFDVKTTLPTSPEAAIIGRFGDIPIGYYTGTADVSIPMYTIKEEGLEIPVVLRYHGSGNKVEDQASNVGLGWSLEPGGSIIQIVNGVVDSLDDLTGFTSEYAFLKANVTPGYYGSRNFIGQQVLPCVLDYSNPNVDSRTLLLRLQKGYGQPDIYQYDFPGGYSGKFYINPETNTPVLINKNEEIKFVHVNDITWTATTLDGIEFTFGAMERSYALGAGGTDYTGRTWKLTNVRLTNGKNIRFKYRDTYHEWFYYSESYHSIYPLDIPNNDYLGTNTGLTYHYTKYLDSIVTNNVHIKFNMEDRDDMFGMSDIDGVSGNGSKSVKRIRSIDIKDPLSGKMIKTYTLNYDYFAYDPSTGGSYTQIPISYPTTWSITNDLLGKRLKLTSVQETGYDPITGIASNLPPYQFQYNESVLMPLKTSYARDYWGYYNGQPNSKLLPDLTYFRNLGTYYPGMPASLLTEVSGANRSVDSTKMGAYLLTKITYPTKGFTEFDYQVHHFSTEPLYGAGMRVSAIRNYTATGFLGNSKRIKYLLSDNSTAGILMSPLQNAYSRNMYFEILLNPVLASSYTKDIWYVSSESVIPYSNAASGGIVGYSRVIEEELSGSSTNGQQIYYYNNTVSGTREFLPDDPDLLNGKLTKQETYNVSGTIKQEINYTYAIKESGSFMGVKVLTNYLHYRDCRITAATPPPFYPVDSYFYLFYPINSKWYVLSSKEVKSYDGATPVVSTETYTYNSKGQQITASLTNSKGETQSTSSLYPADAPQTDPMVQAMVSKGLYSNLLERSTKINTTETSKTTIRYRMDNQLVVQSAIDQSYKGQAPFTATRFDTYGPYATPRQVTQRGQVTSLFWDSSYHYLVASVVNATNGGTAGSSISRNEDVLVGSPQKSFTTYGSGTITLSISPNPGYTYSISYTIHGPSSYYQHGSLCISRSATPCSTGSPETISFANAPGGSYTLDISSSDPTTIPYRALTLSYTGVQTATYANQVYQENFEEGSSFAGGVVRSTDRAHTGHYSGKIVKADAGEVYYESSWLELNETGNHNRRYKYSGWVYSSGPSTQLFLRMNREDEPNYYTYIDNVNNSVTGKWVYMEKEVDVPDDVAKLSLRIDNNGGGTVWYDDLRVMPVNAQMSTYTYDPLVGLTSQVDDKGQTTYYQYDANQRLHQVKDQEGNILKQYDYNYKH